MSLKETTLNVLQLKKIRAEILLQSSLTVWENSQQFNGIELPVTLHSFWLLYLEIILAFKLYGILNAGFQNH